MKRSNIKHIETGRVFGSQAQAAEAFGISQAAISHHVNGRLKYAKFERTDEEVTEFEAPQESKEKEELEAKEKEEKECPEGSFMFEELTNRQTEMVLFPTAGV